MSRREPVKTVADRMLHDWAVKLDVAEGVMDDGERLHCLIEALAQRVEELEADIAELKRAHPGIWGDYE